MGNRLRSIAPLQWIMLPLRLFLGITFLYAGLQKLFDPQFLSPGNPQYIGSQLSSFAPIPFLQGFLSGVAAPHAQVFGILVIVGELAIGLGILAGLLFRPAAFFGLLLNLIFFSCVSWSISPYFYGSDMVFIFCWLPLLLNGPLRTGLPTVDQALLFPLVERLSATRSSLGAALAVCLGAPLSAAELVEVGAEDEILSSVPVATTAPSSRRQFLSGVLAGGIGTMLVFALERSAVLFSQAKSQTATASAARTMIADANSVPVNSAVRFTIPGNENPGLLVHLSSGDFVAYNALCPHANCEVEYNNASQLLTCPCHGSKFDPTRKGAVLHPPANKPLAEVSIHVDQVSGEITANG